MRYPDSLLDQIRQALPVFDLVQKHFKLRKAGSAEYVAIDDKSLTVNTSKNIWHDFGKGQKGGDIFAFEQFVSKCTFQEAIERCAQIAGVSLPSNKRKQAANGHAPPLDDAPPVGEAIPSGQSAFAQRAPDFQITRAYDYVDADGLMVYQTYRREWVDDGKRKKTFGQRRPDGAISESSR